MGCTVSLSMGCWPNEDDVPINAGGRSFHPKLIPSIPSVAAEKKSMLKWSELTPSKKLFKRFDSLSSSKDGPGAGAGGEGKGYAEFDVSKESEYEPESGLKHTIQWSTLTAKRPVLVRWMRRTHTGTLNREHECRRRSTATVYLLIESLILYVFTTSTFQTMTVVDGYCVRCKTA